jgi:AraC-like DNA-binding protein
MQPKPKQPFESLPMYMTDSEVTVVDLTKDGMPCIPVLGQTHYSRRGDGTDPHVHPGMIEILYCRRGEELSFDSAGKIVPFRVGDVFVAQPETPHFLRRYPKNLSMSWLWFRIPRADTPVAGLTLSETRWLVSRLRELPPRFTGGSVIGRAFRRLWQIYDTVHERTPRRLLLREAALHLLMLLIDSPNANRLEQDDDVLESLMAEMRANPEHGWTIDAMAHRVAMSAPKLNLLFKRKTGIPPHAFLVSCRMAAAKEMLAATEARVTDVALQLGFPSSQHFATQFKRETGMTPSDWRKNQQKSKKETKT